MVFTANVCKSTVILGIEAWRHTTDYFWTTFRSRWLHVDASHANVTVTSRQPTIHMACKNDNVGSVYNGFTLLYPPQVST